MVCSPHRVDSGSFRTTCTTTALASLVERDTSTQSTICCTRQQQEEGEEWCWFCRSRLGDLLLVRKVRNSHGCLCDGCCCGRRGQQQQQHAATSTRRHRLGGNTTISSPASAAIAASVAAADLVFFDAVVGGGERCDFGGSCCCCCFAFDREAEASVPPLRTRCRSSAAGLFLPPSLFPQLQDDDCLQLRCVLLMLPSWPILPVADVAGGAAAPIARSSQPPPHGGDDDDE
jgi:hypothetical protein